MVIDSPKRVWMFSIVTTAIAILFAEVLNLAVFPPELLSATMPGTFIIVVCVCMPITLYVGRKMHENALLSIQLQEMVDRDRLTDVATRDFFFSKLTEFPDAYGASLMVDIDHFKAVNDVHGHLAGDRVIHSVAQILQKETRAKDIVCRFGGEEFVIFLHEAGRAQSTAIAERIRAATQALKTVTPDGDVNVTISVGGSLKARLDHVDESIKRADACLYRAKELGRNRVIMDWDKEADGVAA